MAQPKVLVAAPVFDGMKYCIRQFLDSMRSLTYTNYKILIVDNSRSNNFFEELKKEPSVMLIKDPTAEEQNIKRLVNSRNIILDYALENNYDHILMMDSDTIPPNNIIEELLSQNKEIVSGLYYNYFNSSGQIKLLPVAWKSVTEQEFEEMKKQIRFPQMIKSNKDLRRHLTKEEANSNQLIEVIQTSAGCMLISRRAFKKIRYGILPVPEGVHTSDDVYFSEKAQESGFKIYCCTKLKCSHLIKGKYQITGDNKLLHPLHESYGK